jgi:hypothetical protein
MLPACRQMLRSPFSSLVASGLLRFRSQCCLSSWFPMVDLLRTRVLAHRTSYSFALFNLFLFVVGHGGHYLGLIALPRSIAFTHQR